jgi:hypothetical protein
LDENRKTAIAVAVSGVYKGRNTIFVVQLFGTPAPAAVATTAATPIIPSVPSVVPPPETTQTVVAGAQTTTVETSAQETHREVTLAQELVTNPATPSNTAGASVQTTDVPPVVEHVASQASPWQEFLLQPRAIVKFVYLIIGLLLACVVLLMVWHQVHTRHSREFLHGLALLVLIVLLFYFNYLLLSKDLLVI